MILYTWIDRIYHTHDNRAAMCPDELVQHSVIASSQGCICTCQSNQGYRCKAHETEQPVLAVWPAITSMQGQLLPVIEVGTLSDCDGTQGSGREVHMNSCNNRGCAHTSDRSCTAVPTVLSGGRATQGMSV
jgi:hypothetical protein